MRSSEPCCSCCWTQLLAIPCLMKKPAQAFDPSRTTAALTEHVAASIEEAAQNWKAMNRGVPHQRVPIRASSVSKVTSLAFWVALLISALIWGLILFAPRILNWELQFQRYSANALALQKLRKEIAWWEQVLFTLKYDATFAQRVTRWELDGTGTGDLIEEVSARWRFGSDRLESIPVTLSGLRSPLPIASLNTTNSTGSLLEESPKPLQLPAWLRNSLEAVAVPGTFRNQATLLATSLCLLGFICLHEGFTRSSFWRVQRRLWRNIADRYRPSQNI